MPVQHVTGTLYITCMYLCMFIQDDVFVQCNGLFSTPVYIYSVIQSQLFCGMGWLRLEGSLKTYVSFAEYSLLYRALLQKSPMF